MELIFIVLDQETCLFMIFVAKVAFGVILIQFELQKDSNHFCNPEHFDNQNVCSPDQSIEWHRTNTVAGSVPNMNLKTLKSTQNSSKPSNSKKLQFLSDSPV